MLRVFRANVETVSHMPYVSTWHNAACLRSFGALLSRLVSRDGGQDLAEYGIALAMIGAVGAVVAVLISTDVGALWTSAQSVIHTSTQ